MACALLYNFKDAARLQKVRFALFKLGVSGRVVAPEELSQPIGYLCDLEGFSPVEETVEGGFSDEMLVLCGLSGPQLDALLSSLRRSRVVVALKGVGRFTELATPAARERFIVGTLASLLWACAVAGIVPPPLYRRAFESDVEARSACSTARTSIHMIAGRIALPESSIATTVIVVAS